MKKNIILVFISLFIFVSTNIVSAEGIDKDFTDGYYSETSEIYLNSNESEREFLDLQNEITLSLGEINAKYVYDEVTIRNIINKYDFNLINKSMDSPIDKESFINDVLYSLDTVKIEKPSPNSVSLLSRGYPTGKLCGHNGSYSIWNSMRDYLDKEESEDYVHTVRQLALKLGAGATVGGAVLGPFSGGVLTIILGAVGTLGVTKFTLMGNDVEHYNSKSSCGTVVDLNRFTYHHYVFSQKDTK